MTTRTGASGTAKPPPQQQQQQQQREEQDRFVDYANQQLLPLYKRPSLVMVRGEGCHLFDMTGKRLVRMWLSGRAIAVLR